jgi:hypothetical protein
MPWNNKNFFKEDQCQLGMSKWESPQTQVWCCVWNCSKNEFDRFDKLMNENLIHVVISVGGSVIFLVQKFVVSLNIGLSSC